MRGAGVMTLPPIVFDGCVSHTSEAAAPGVAVACIVTAGSPATDITSDCTPATVPSVHAPAAAVPSPSLVATPLGVSVPPSVAAVDPPETAMVTAVVAVVTLPKASTMATCIGAIAPFALAFDGCTFQVSAAGLPASAVTAKPTLWPFDSAAVAEAAA